MSNERFNIELDVNDAMLKQAAKPKLAVNEKILKAEAIRLFNLFKEGIITFGKLRDEVLTRLDQLEATYSIKKKVGIRLLREELKTLKEQVQSSDKPEELHIGAEMALLKYVGDRVVFDLFVEIERGKR